MRSAGRQGQKAKIENLLRLAPQKTTREREPESSQHQAVSK